MNNSSLQNSGAPLPIPSVSPPDTHRRLKLNLRCVSGGAREGLRRGAWGIECASASTYGIVTSVSEPHEGSNRFELGNGGSRLGNAGRRTGNSGHVCKHLWLQGLLVV